MLRFWTGWRQDGETGKRGGGSVWSGDYSRYHVLRFLSFITMVLPNIRCQCSPCTITGIWGWISPSISSSSFPFNKKGETVVGVRGLTTKRFEDRSQTQGSHYIPYINKLFSRIPVRSVEQWKLWQETNSCGA